MEFFFKTEKLASYSYTLSKNNLNEIQKATENVNHITISHLMAKLCMQRYIHARFIQLQSHLNVLIWIKIKIKNVN